MNISICFHTSVRLVFINMVPIFQVSQQKLKEIKNVSRSQKANSQP